jgi:type II secretory pathway pseudopilin PulG
VELVVVIAILAILAAIAVPVVATTINKATLTTALANAKTLENSLRLAEADIDTNNDDTYGESALDETLKVKDVIRIQALEDSCKPMTYEGRDFVFVWDFIRKGVYLKYTDDNTDVESGSEITDYIVVSPTDETFVTTLS